MERAYTAAERRRAQNELLSQLTALNGFIRVIQRVLKTKNFSQQNKDEIRRVSDESQRVIERITELLEILPRRATSSNNTILKFFNVLEQVNTLIREQEEQELEEAREQADLNNNNNLDAFDDGNDFDDAVDLAAPSDHDPSPGPQPQPQPQPRTQRRGRRGRRPAPTPVVEQPQDDDAAYNNNNQRPPTPPPPQRAPRGQAPRGQGQGQGQTRGQAPPRNRRLAGRAKMVQGMVEDLIDEIVTLSEHVFSDGNEDVYKMSVYWRNSVLPPNINDPHNDPAVLRDIDARAILVDFRRLVRLVMGEGAALPGQFSSENLLALPSRTADDKREREIEMAKRLMEFHFYIRRTDFVYDFHAFPGRNQEIQEAYHKELIKRLFAILSILPISNGTAFFILQVNFDIVREIPQGQNNNNNNNNALQGVRNVTRYWYLHPHSTTHILTGLMNYVRTIDTIDYEREEAQAGSDPISILMNLRHLHAVRFMPLSTYTHELANNTLLPISGHRRRPQGLFRYAEALANGVRINSDIELVRTNNTPLAPQTALIQNTIIPGLRDEIIADQERFINACDFQQLEPGDINNYRQWHMGGFFPFFNGSDLDLSRYQIATCPEDFRAYPATFDESCLLYAFRKSGVFSEAEIEQISTICYGRVIPIRKLMRVCRSMNFAVKLKKYYGDRKKEVSAKTDITKEYVIGLDVNSETPQRVIHLGLVKDHFFIIDKEVKVTAYYLEHYHEIHQAFQDNPELAERMTPEQMHSIRGMKKDGRYYTSKDRYIDSFNIIRILLETREQNGLLYPVMMSDVISLEMTLYKQVEVGHNKEYLGDLNYDPKLCLQSFERYNKVTTPKAVGNNAYQKIKEALRSKGEKLTTGQVLVFFADFETFTVDDDGEALPKHIPFMCCVTHNDTNIIETFEGDDCGRQLLEYIEAVMGSDPKYENWVPLIYFHNLGYDINFLAKYGIVSSLPKGRKMLNTEIIFGDRVFTFKDSASLLPMKLASFGSVFGLEVHKELFPYKFYTASRYYGPHRTETPVQDVIDMMGWDKTENKRTFINNIREVEDKTVFDEITVFDMYKYASFYCKKDVEVLKQGLNIFCDSIKSDFEIDAINYLSVSSIADAIFNKQVYSKIGNLYRVGGIVREFLSYAVHGGRVMPSENKKWAYKISPDDVSNGYGLCDFDAVSLYPSAMARLWLVDGKPEVFENWQLVNNSFMRDPKISAYVVEILITKIPIKRQFPLVIGRNHLTGSVLNTNDPPVRMTVCDIELEDLIKFQGIEFTTIRGLFWRGNKHTQIQKCIRGIFEKRAEYKKEGNPIQNVYKLIMNSIYGKTILKPHMSEFKYFKNDDPELKSFFRHHASEVQYIAQIDGCDISALKRAKPIGQHFNFSLFGIHILAMSKRIMNEVMCLAEDLGMRIFYQDTDSMHIENHNLDYLAREYKKLYGRELIGSDLGQFHSDFDLKPESTNVRSIEGYFIGKKCYIDKLLDDQRNIGYHIRLKGVPQAAIYDAAEKYAGGSVIRLYKLLFTNNTIEFDLLAGSGVKFDYGRDMTIKNKSKFIRRVNFFNPVKPEEYENGTFMYKSPSSGKFYEWGMSD